MTPEPDPNKAIEDGLKEDGEFLRDVDKGMSSTETGFGIDLGIVRDDHSETIEEMQEIADSDAPAVPESPVSPEMPPDAPVQVQAEHSEVLEEMQQVADEDQPPGETPQAPPSTPDFPGERLQRRQPSAGEVQAGHGQAFVELGNFIRKERAPDERPTPVTADPAELERLTFPGEQHQSEVRGSMESWIREQREWMAAVADLFRLSAEMHRQDRLELELIRGKLERIRL